MKREVFDPAMRCSSGVCGTDVDAVLVQIAADVKWLLGRGATVQRYDLSQQPGAFTSTSIVRRAVQVKGPERLPPGLLNGTIVFDSRHPAREELAPLVELGKEINPSLAASGTTDVPLAARAAAERPLIERVQKDLAGRTVVVPWQAEPPIGPHRLRAVIADTATRLENTHV